MIDPESHSYTPTRWTDDMHPIVPGARSDIHVEFLGDEAVAYDDRSTNTFHFNSSALCVWRQCDGRTTTEEMAAQQVAAFDIDVETALDHVEQLVAMFADAGLLEPEVTA